MNEQTHNLDELVATYAARGRARQRQQFSERLSKGCYGGGALLAAALLGIAATRVDWPVTVAQPSNAPPDVTEVAERAVAELEQARQLSASLSDELDRVEAQRAELARQRALLHEQQAALSADFAQLDTQQKALLARQSGIAQHQERLDAARAQLELRQRDLGFTKQQIETEGPQLQAALDELRSQRRELDDERKRFRAQRDLLEHEIALLNEQRTALQDQQQRLQAEWESLQHMMEQAANLRQQRHKQVTDEPLAAGITGEPDQGDLPLTLDTDTLLAAGEQRIADGELGEIRGGFDIGGKLDISIGLTRSVDINGVQQYASALRFNGARAVGYDELAAMTPVVIQNGDGNTADLPALGAWSGRLPVIIQNSLDNQHIMNANVLDVTISNVASRAAGLSAEAAVSDSLAFQK